MLRSRSLLLALFLLPLMQAPAALAHGSHGGGGSEGLEEGEFDFTPIVTVEWHAGFDNNLEDSPRHDAFDGLFGGVFEWGLSNGGSLSIEAAVGPALVWGEAEHFYGKVHAHDDHGDHEDEHDQEDHDDDHDDHEKHDHDDHDDDHGDHDEHDHEDHDDHDHEDHDDHDDHDDDHGDHEEHDHEEHDHHGHGPASLKRSDVRGFLSVRYAPNDRLSFKVDWAPYYVTRDQGEDIQGLKNEVGAEVVWALGDGDVDFSLGDGLEDVVDGMFLLVRHRQGWESDGTYIGNYTDPRVGFGFNVNQVNVTMDAGPRFYVPGSYSGLDSRTDFAGEVELSVPIGDATLFVHWQPTYSGTDAPGWGVGWQHHVGTGMTFSF